MQIEKTYLYTDVVGTISKGRRILFPIHSEKFNNYTTIENHTIVISVKNKINDPRLIFEQITFGIFGIEVNIFEDFTEMEYKVVDNFIFVNLPFDYTKSKLILSNKNRAMDMAFTVSLKNDTIVDNIHNIFIRSDLV
jgi:hypothetical protein